MIPLNAVALEKNTSTNAFKVEAFGKFTVYFRGNLNNETLTMQISFDNSAWKSFHAAAVAQTYTNNADVINAVDYELGGPVWIRWTMSNGAGTVSGVFVHVVGTNVKKP